MNEVKKKVQENTSSNNLSIINSTNLMNKIFVNKNENKNKRPFQKIKTAFKKDKGIGDFKINDIQKGYTSEYKFKRIWSSQNMFLYNKSNKNKYGTNLFGKNFNIYCIDSIYSAPSVRDNRIEINKLLKYKKIKRLKYLNNIHNNLMIKESKLYRQKLSSASKDNSFDNKVKNNLKRKYNMNDMNEINNINNIKNNLLPHFKGYNIINNKRNFSSYGLSLKKYRYLSNGKKNFNSFNDNTLSTNKTNYLSKYFSGKKSMKTINEIKNNKTNDINYLTNSYNILSAGTANLSNKSNKYKKLEFIIKKPLLKSNSMNYLNNTIKLEKKNENTDRIYKDYEISKMSLELNDILFNQKRKTNKLNELELKLIKFNALKDFQKKRLEKMSKQDINGLLKRIILLEDSIKKYNKISFLFFLEINDYLQFLKNKKYNLSNYYEEEKNKIFNLYFDIEKLITDNIIKQKELENLIEIKHFLIQVKNTLIKLPNYFNNILKEASRKYELGKLILGLKIRPQNQNILKFLESIPEIKDGEIPKSSQYQSQLKNVINKNNSKKKNKKNSQISLLRNKLSDNLLNKYIIEEKKIFDSPEEFIIIFDNIESKNLRLMKENDYIKKNIDTLKREYNDVFQSNKIIEKYIDINKKEEKLKKLIEENILLREKYNYLKNNKNNDEENDSKNKNKKIMRSFFMDINIFKKITYYKMLQNYKYKGSLFLNRLIDIIKEFFALNYTNYGIDKAYKLVEKNILNKILIINKKNINNIDRITINNYILCLLKIYENICEYIKYKDKEYNSNELNRYIIHKKKEEIQLQRKIKNTRTIRQLAEEKRINGIEKIIKKNSKPNLLFKGNVDQNVVLRSIIKKKKKFEEMGKNKNNYLEKEFNFYIKYGDEN